MDATSAVAGEPGSRLRRWAGMGLLVGLAILAVNVTAKLARLVLSIGLLAAAVAAVRALVRRRSSAADPWTGRERLVPATSTPAPPTRHHLPPY